MNATRAILIDAGADQSTAAYKQVKARLKDLEKAEKLVEAARSARIKQAEALTATEAEASGKTVGDWAGNVPSAQKFLETEADSDTAQKIATARTQLARLEAAEEKATKLTDLKREEYDDAVLAWVKADAWDSMAEPLARILQKLEPWDPEQWHPLYIGPCGLAECKRPVPRGGGTPKGDYCSSAHRDRAALQNQSLSKG